MSIIPGKICGHHLRSMSRPSSVVYASTLTTACLLSCPKLSGVNIVGVAHGDGVGEAETPESQFRCASGTSKAVVHGT